MKMTTAWSDLGFLVGNSDAARKQGAPAYYEVQSRPYPPTASGGSEATSAAASAGQAAPAGDAAPG